MSASIQSSLKSTTSCPLPASAIVYKDRLIKGKENVCLLRVPSIESDVVWKTYSVKFAYNILRSKLGEPYSAETLISVLRDHFSLSSQQSANKAATMVEKFCGGFGDTTYLSP